MLQYGGGVGVMGERAGRGGKKVENLDAREGKGGG